MRFFRNIGTIIFLPLFGYIMNLTLTKSANINIGHTQALVLSIQNIFLTAIVLAFIGLVVSFLLKELPLDENKSTKS
jgi:Na+/phosphate symporter